MRGFLHDCDGVHLILRAPSIDHQCQTQQRVGYPPERLANRAAERLRRAKDGIHFVHQSEGEARLPRQAVRREAPENRAAWRGVHESEALHLLREGHSMLSSVGG